MLKFNIGDWVRRVRGGLGDYPEFCTVNGLIEDGETLYLQFLDTPMIGDADNYELVSDPVPVTRSIGDLLFDETTEMTTSETGGNKGVKTCRYELIPAEALAELAAAYGVGAKKYGEGNYLQGYGYSRAFGAMLRHAYRFWRGEDFDPETGIHHLALAAWHCFTLMTFRVRNIGEDDRPHATNT